MTIKLICEKVKELKQLILTHVKENIEILSWRELTASLNPNQKGIYRILDDDLPVVRDLKAFLNMLTAIESITARVSTKYALFGASIDRVMIVNDLYYFNQNFKIYRSTNSIFTHYLSYVKEVGLTLVWPQLKVKMQELIRLCTTENLDKIAGFFIEQVISLEQYQANYLRKKLTKTSQAELTQEKKDDQSEDFIATIVKKNDQYLRRMYKEKYNEHFGSDVKLDEKKNQIIDYYPDNKKDTDFIKNIKLLLNGIIGVKKVLDDHDAYQQSGIYGSVIYYMPSLVSNLRKVYANLGEFDYQAIIAEKSTPITEEIKKQLSTLNDMLEKLACIADQFELELRLKEGTLLEKVNLIVERHNQIMEELRIPTDYLKQKHIYYMARLHSRQSTLAEIGEQLQVLRQFMIYKNYALIDIPYVINIAMQAYIKKYYDDICMNRHRLDRYQKYLISAADVKRGFKSFVMSQLESLANLSGCTLHAELMSSLYNRQLYLKKQSIFIINKNQQIQEYHKMNPYDHVKLSEINELGQQAVILKLLKCHSSELALEQEKLFSKAVMKKDVKPESKDTRNETKEKNIDKDKTKIRLFNKIQIKAKEREYIDSVIKTFEDKKVIPTIDMVAKEVGLSPKSFTLLYELDEVSNTNKRLGLVYNSLG